MHSLIYSISFSLCLTSLCVIGSRFIHLIKTESSALLLQFISVAQLCPMYCTMPGFPVHHHLPELAQTHVHRLGDAIQPSHPLLYPLLLPSIFPSIRIFLNESFLCIRWPKYWSFSFIISLSNEYLGLVYFRIDILGIIYIRNHF